MCDAVTPCHKIKRCSNCYLFHCRIGFSYPMRILRDKKCGTLGTECYYLPAFYLWCLSLYGLVIYSNIFLMFSGFSMLLTVSNSLVYYWNLWLFLLPHQASTTVMNTNAFGFCFLVAESSYSSIIYIRILLRFLLPECI